MENMLHLGLSNAVAAVVLALIAAAAAFLVRRRPALIHGLWILVLIKLVTPPLVRIPAPWTMEPDRVAAQTAPEGAATAPVDPEPRFVFFRMAAEEEQARDERIAEDFVGPMQEVADAPIVDAEERISPSATAAVPSLPAPSVFLVAACIWVAGSVGWFVLAGIRVLRFRRLLRFAEPAPLALRERTERLARKLGMKHSPAVWLVPGRLSPMVWAAGGAARLLVPGALLGKVRDDQLDTLLLHELAHLRRRDHWVRGLEFLVMGLYWWNPVVWWARRELREAEEQCCDAWVVSVLAGSRRAYAEALVETLDFLSQAAPATPLLASGIGHVSDLKRRLTMILNGTTPRALTWRGGLTVLGLGALLPLLPAWVRAQPPAAEKQAIEARKVLELQLDKLTFDIDVNQGKSETQKLEAELKKKLEEVHDLERRLREAHARAKAAEAPKPAPKLGQGTFWMDFGGGNKGIIMVPDHLNKVGAATKGTLYELVPGEKGTLILRPVTQQVQPQGQGGLRFQFEGGKTPPNPPLPGQSRPGANPANPTEAKPSIVWQVVPTPPAVKAAPQVPTQPGVPLKIWMAPTQIHVAPTPRGKDLETRLDEIMKELEQIRQEMKTRKAPTINPTSKPDTKPKPQEEEQQSRRREELMKQRAELEQVIIELRKAVEARQPRRE